MAGLDRESIEKYRAIRSLGGFVGIYVPLYFVQIGGSPLTLGLFGSVASIIQFFTFAIGGLIADYYGRRRVIALSAFYFVFFPFLYAVVQDLKNMGWKTGLGSAAFMQLSSHFSRRSWFLFHLEKHCD